MYFGRITLCEACTIGNEYAALLLPGTAGTIFIQQVEAGQLVVLRTLTDIAYQPIHGRR